MLKRLIPLALALLVLCFALYGLIAMSVGFWTRPADSPEPALTIFNARSGIPPIMVAAQEDIQRVMKNAAPLHARLFAVNSDGGSSIFRADEYEITVWKRSMTVAGVEGEKRGFSVVFYATASSRYPRPDMDLSHSWFEPAANPGK